MGSVTEFERETFVASKRPQLLAAFSITIGAYAIGTICCWSAPAIVDLEKSGHFGELSLTEKTWAASIVPLGALAAGPFGGFLVDHYGRRMTMLITAMPLFLGWLLIAFSPNITTLIAGRFVTGLCIGTMSVAIPMYIAEITEENIRGSVSNLFPFMAGLGILNTYIFGSFMNWFDLTLSNAVVPIVLFLAVYFLPESPIFLLSKGKTEKARKALKWLRGADSSSEATEPELQQFRRSIDDKKDRKLSAKEFFSPAVIKPNIICISLMFFQQMSGINAVVFYTVKIFQSAGTSIDPNLSSIIVGIVLLISITISAFLIDRIGRKILLILSDGGMALGLLGLGLFFYLKDQNASNAGTTIDYCGIQPNSTNNGTSGEIDIDSELAGLAWLPLASLMLFVFCFNLGYGPVPWLYLGELLPSHVKGFGAGLATAFSWFMAFLVTKSFEDFICYLGTYGCFWMFGIVSIVGTVFCCLFVPETKGKTLNEIQNAFQ